MKIFIVTRGALGVGYELIKILYNQDGNVYVAARLSEKVNRVIKSIKADVRSSKGHLAPLILDLVDFPTIKNAVNENLQNEGRLDLLV